MKDKTEITFLFEQSTDNKEFYLTLISPEAMTEDDYILALKDFIQSLQTGNVDFLSEANPEVH